MSDPMDVLDQPVTKLERTPLGRQIADAVRNDILHGLLEPGSASPSKSASRRCCSDFERRAGA